MFSRRSIIRCIGAAAPVAMLAAGWRLANAEPLPLAIKGFDPVAYFTVGFPTRGLPDFEYEWDEQRYRFASAENRDLFKSAPVRYAPRFSNFCAMALARGIVHEADPQHWLVSDGSLYLFATGFGPKLFQEDLARNAAKADENGPLLKR